jgi:16S rRNA (uracil1498-N3)-methyltransferase
MTRKCFYTELIDHSQGQAVLEDQTAHHVKNVLRMKTGETLEIRDGRGRGWKGFIREMGGGKVWIQLVESVAPTIESSLDLTLGLPLARSDRMDLIVRQATEIGSTRLIIFKAERSQYALSESQARKRRDRWMKIAHEAMCQCGRMRAPEISICMGVPEFLSLVEEVARPGAVGLRIIAVEENGGQNILSLWRACPIYGQVSAVVGPEGGWAPFEVSRFVESGFQPVHLGPRILRFETAAAVLLTSSQMLWGDFGKPL